MNLPGRLETSIGNGYEGYYVVRLVSDGSLIWSFERGEPVEPYESIVPDTAAWETFARLLARLGVFAWLPTYDNPNAVDGTCWGLLCEWGDLSVHASGANAFPLGFEEFCLGIEALLGGHLTFR